MSGTFGTHGGEGKYVGNFGFENFERELLEDLVLDGEIIYKSDSRNFGWDWFHLA
jgi:hypothetical protein